MALEPLAGPAAKVLLAVGLAQPLLVLIMLVANSKRVMGKHTNGRWINVLGWAPHVRCSPPQPGWS
jgi:Mn2+/Fe2+ NRAMP family transporter